MNEEDRDKITVHCAKLVPAINWPHILPKLLQHNIFGKEDINLPRWQANLHSIDNNRDIYLTIMRRGPEAFESFLLCLNEVGQTHLANLLKPEDPVDQVDNDKERVIPEVNGNVSQTYNQSTQVLNNTSDDFYTMLQHSFDPLKVNVTKSTTFMDSQSGKVLCYMMQSNPRGLVLIINNILFGGNKPDRLDAEHDERNLKTLFEQMGFRVITRHNLKGKEMSDEIDTFSRDPDLRKANSTFVIIMSHGMEHDKGDRPYTLISGTDGEYLTPDMVLSSFTATACKDMCRKPKVFIFQTCRGASKQNIVHMSNISIGRHLTDSTEVVVKSDLNTTPKGCRDISDTLVVYSTLPRHEAHRDKYTGSWYIQLLCEVFMNHAYDTDLLRLFQMTDERLSYQGTASNVCQTSEITNLGFNKKCYLNPGLFLSTTDT